MIERYTETIEIMLRASELLRLSIQTERELRLQIVIQRNRIDVARAYLLSGRRDLATMVLTDEPKVGLGKCPECGGAGYTQTEYGPIRCGSCELGGEPEIDHTETNTDRYASGLERLVKTYPWIARIPDKPKTFGRTDLA